MKKQQIDFKQRLRVIKRSDSPRCSQELSKEDFESYMQKIATRRIEILAHTKSMLSAKFLGRYADYIEEALREEIERLYGTTMMIHAERTLGNASTRGTHIYNTAQIAYKIAIGLFKDEEIAKGIALAALLHDIGQPAFGHDGENMATRASKKGQGGPHPHNATGATRTIYRDSRKISRAIDKGIAMETLKRVANERKISIEELSKKIDESEELQQKIKDDVDRKSKGKEEAIRTLAMATGRHNGERGTANIIPNYQVTFKEFCKTLERCYVYPGEDKKLQSANMVDAIVKISDQLSSIPYDMIDGKRGGVVLDIPEEFAKSVSDILGITEETAKRRLKTNDVGLVRLVEEIQTKLIESVVQSSTKSTINMDQEMAQFLYGAMRKCIYSEYLGLTTSLEEEQTLERAWIDASEQLSTVILDERGIFPPDLNVVFRMQLNDPRRSVYTEELRQNRGFEEGNPLKEFYDYILETSPREYQSIKRELSEYGINLLRKSIENARKKYAQGTTQYETDWDNIEQGVINYLQYAEIPEPENGEEYTDEEVKVIYQSINAARREKGQIGILLQRDKRLAIQLSIRFLESKFNDKSFIDFCLGIGVLTEEEAKRARQKYNPLVRNKYQSGAVKQSTQAYKEAEEEMGVGVRMPEQEEI